MKDLIQRVRKECADGYCEAPQNKIQPFGALPEESAYIYLSCLPCNQFPRSSLSSNYFSRFLTRINPFKLPKPLQRLVDDEAKDLRRKTAKSYEDHNQLYIFQYPLNLERIASYVNYWFNRPGFEIDCPNLSKSGPKEFLKQFRQRFRKGSCIYLKFTDVDQRKDLNIPLITGKKK